ncbi:glucose-6-phosphate isomerase [Nitrincola tapanii]|uniref:Glucose-6-phosphate isomerase n=1 Tax=Nitrincola tapanii TaxID=1708751 RepID=A0A5A9W8H5_9GAMM|nr:glucose-6-phosphate isomerase [Nitrincola tapanii]KAA0875781.1 glucose-6-phosphate isomerase [Nitrincola tapanii]
MNVFATDASARLYEHAKFMGQRHIAQLFQEDPNRFQKLSFELDELLVDFAKQRLSTETLQHLCQLAEEKALKRWIKRLFNGEKINTSENRPALHTALRTPIDQSLLLDGTDVIQQVHENLDRMSRLVECIHSEQWLGCTGTPINTLVNIGVGGSDLGPFMACKALGEFSSPASEKLEIHFVSSMDGSHLSSLLSKLDPTRTLFVISSKSFTTIDTLANAETAREWLKRAEVHAEMDESLIIKRHFIGVSASPQRMVDWGIPESNHLYFWEWTGGRYSMWSTIGLPIALRIGMEGFRDMLAGAHVMDCHFRDTPFTENLPVLLALVGIWNINFLNITAHAILPYDGRLSHLPSYLEQLEMESNGKSTTRHNDQVNYHTCPILWGEIGTNAQHAFYQLLHQGTVPVMCDFITSAKRYEAPGHEELKHQHQLNLSNCLAQSQILALGDTVIKDADQAPAYKRYRGNQPCTTLLMQRLSPYTFGMLIALYEHKVFVQSVIWDINPFDQWGVELGKTIATGLLPALTQEQACEALDSSTLGLIRHINR